MEVKPQTYLRYIGNFTIHLKLYVIELNYTII